MELLTATELGKRVGLPEATVRSYHDRYPSLIPAVGTGRSRRYYAEAVAPLRFVAESLRAGMPEAVVHAALVSRFAPAQPSPLLAGVGTPDYLSPDGLRALIAEAVRDALASRTVP